MKDSFARQSLSLFMIDCFVIKDPKMLYILIWFDYGPFILKVYSPLAVVKVTSRTC